MANNKVVYAGRVLIDLTEDTVERDKLAEGITAHNKKGETIIGTATLLNAQPQVTVTPSDTEQIIIPQSPYNALSSVKVEASQGGSVELPDFADDIAYLITGDCEQRFYNKSGLLEQYAYHIATKDINNARQMFWGVDLELIPFAINCDFNFDIDMYRMFYQASNLRYAPTINHCSPSYVQAMFSGCYNLIEVSGEFYQTSYAITNCSQVFRDCYNLRKTPVSFLSIWEQPTLAYTYFNRGFQNCFSLVELVNLPLPEGTDSTNRFSYTFDKCASLKRLTFENFGNEYRSWTNQTLDLRSVGYMNVSDYNNYGSYLPHSIINDDTSYEESLIYESENTPYLALSPEYSKYNHDSAVETIKSLPQTDGSNTIIFKTNSGSLTDGGAVGDLTEEEIAIAIDKGWIVSLT